MARVDNSGSYLLIMIFCMNGIGNTIINYKCIIQIQLSIANNIDQHLAICS